VKSATATAQGKVSSAANATIDAAKEHPYAAAGLAAGVAAAVAGGAYAASKLGEGKTRKAKSGSKSSSSKPGPAKSASKASSSKSSTKK